jgi:hypothetical protein
MAQPSKGSLTAAQVPATMRPMRLLPPILPVRLVALIAVTGALVTPVNAASHWMPAANMSWQVQFSGRIDLSVPANAFDLDMFDTAARLVGRVHHNGDRAVCYVNAGAWEDWRPDADAYPSVVKGKALDGWPGERWLDIRRLDILGPIISARLDQCASKRFDGVEFDNVDGYQNNTGFSLARSDQLAFDRWLAGIAHDHGLAVGLKNSLGLADELEPSFDFAITEQCFQYRECALTAPFVDAGKSVIDIEYSMPRTQFCAKAARLGISAMRKHLDLDAWRRAC